MVLIYVALAIGVLLSASYVVFSRNTVHAALFLVITMICLAGIYLLILAPFVALIQILVYAGAIVILFLYVIMLLNPRKMTAGSESRMARSSWAMSLSFFFLFSTLIWLLYIYPRKRTPISWEVVPVQVIATRLLSDFLLPFELLSVLLLIAIVGAVLIARRN